MISNAIRQLHPGYFAFIMATGIVSIAAGLLGYPGLSDALLIVAGVGYPALVVLYAIRGLWFSQNFVDDLCSGKKAFAFFTFVAGTNVLGSRLLIAGQPDVAWVLWLTALVAWTVLMYTTFSALFFSNERPVEEIINGGWLLVIVATQSVAVLGSMLSGGVGSGASLLLFFSYCFWAIGVMFYILFIGWILYRFIFYRLQPGHLGPPYWINMGAVAISTLAGASLILAADGLPLLTDLYPFVAGLTILLWAWGSWWVPMLLVLGVWKHVVRQVPFTYEPGLWGMVFPMGMYTTATLKLGKAIHMEQLGLISSTFIWLAVAAWAITFGGMVLSNARALMLNDRGGMTLDS